ncbi:NUDIX domain-containing protein [Herbiconiux sp. CPCC 205763]|uniref:NUDIX domain-containing protein n=1 Tax=Herbiconiux aconitum TaxID=2970913 RepID=A0ABT2GML9_9MICO|nr:NUDIX domain-containing protein [Herbiconiux aconitum]MCS5717476.1 NUDIX domain-containing protein [Herbiconiux aconitum]
MTEASTTAPEPGGDDSAPLPTIRVAALALLRERRVLMVTARARDVYYMPGGKIDAGETAAEAAVREAFEEVSVRVDAAAVHPLFTVTVQAHGEPEGRLVEMQVFQGSTPDAPRASSEVDAVHWVTSADEHRCPPAGAETLRRLHALDLID